MKMIEQTKSRDHEDLRFWITAFVVLAIIIGLSVI